MSVLQQSSATKNSGGEGKSVEDESSEVWRGRYWGIGGLWRENGRQGNPVGIKQRLLSSSA